MNVLLRSAVFTLLVPGTVVGLIPWLILRQMPSGEVNWRAASSIAGLAAIAAGLGIYARCAWEFGARGKGTPAPWDPPQRVVTTSLYQRTRNPMYLGMILVLLGETALFTSAALLGWALFMLVAFHLRVVLYEEPILRREFGETYESYRQSVPRWLPRVRFLH